MDQEVTDGWALASGNWVISQKKLEVRFTRTRLGNTPAQVVSAADVAHVMGMRGPDNGGSVRFPPEFTYSPFDGARLLPAAPAPGAWIPPWGARGVTEPAESGATGLRQAKCAFAGLRHPPSTAESPADFSMDLPPPGAYEFFSGRFGTIDAVLLALDTAKGSLFGWLPASRRWRELHAMDGKLLAESALPSRAWRAELAENFYSRLFVPTEKGLASVVPDLAALRYQLEYIGQGPAAGAPICFDGKVWAPIRLADGSLQFASGEAGGGAGAAPPPLAADTGAIGSPVAYGRMAVWPCARGQLRLQKNTDGGMAGSFAPWPAGIAPHFEFGCAYLSGSGALWQFCFHGGIGQYQYVRLGVREPEQIGVPTPRMCAGSVTYRFASKQKTDPWDEPAHGDDSGATMLVVPLLELNNSRTVFGVRLANDAALAQLLNSPQKRWAQLLYDDDTSEVAFHTFSVGRPWDLRLVFHANTLLLYHPGIARLHGWELA